MRHIIYDSATSQVVEPLSDPAEFFLNFVVVPHEGLRAPKVEARVISPGGRDLPDSARI
jgi:hypothetical protein